MQQNCGENSEPDASLNKDGWDGLYQFKFDLVEVVVKAIALKV